MIDNEILQKLAEYLINEAGNYTAVFWSGLEDIAAAALCAEWGGNFKTIQMILTDELDISMSDILKYARGDWDKLSDIFSRFFRGDYRLITGDKIRTGGVYNLIERLPA